MGEAIMSDERKPGGPDLTIGGLPADFTEGKLLDHVANAMGRQD
jgi:hypothetical protein